MATQDGFITISDLETTSIFDSSCKVLAETPDGTRAISADTLIAAVANNMASGGIFSALTQEHITNALGYVPAQTQDGIIPDSELNIEQRALAFTVPEEYEEPSYGEASGTIIGKIISGIKSLLNKILLVQSSIDDFKTEYNTHNHDERYYTETEIDEKLTGKANSTHTHNYVPLDGGATVGGTIKFNNIPQAKYGSGFYNLPFNRGNNSISFLWTTSGLNIYIDTTLIGTLPNGFSNTNFKVNGMNFGDNIYLYNNGSGQLYCRTGTNGNYSYKQLAP